MDFTQNNRVLQLCAKGMELEGEGQLIEASHLFAEAWNTATTDIERFTAAHYVARHQNSVSGKLKWDEMALTYALNIDDETIKEVLPSLYLNIGIGYEDLKDLEKAKSNYQAAFSFAGFLPDNGYGNMIKAGITKGLERMK
jgi:rifampin ADP-ribosylating transferase